MVESPICQTSHDSGESESQWQKLLNWGKGDKGKMKKKKSSPLSVRQQSKIPIDMNKISANTHNIFNQNIILQSKETVIRSPIEKPKNVLWKKKPRINEEVTNEILIRNKWQKKKALGTKNDPPRLGFIYKKTARRPEFNSK